MKKTIYYSLLVVWLLSLAICAFVLKLEPNTLIFIYVITQGLMVSIYLNVFKKKSCSKS
ncbi:hypothetical protein SAMN04488096_101225 [Mesonia phycicola]|uniref:Uncharacterized protein n=1 Tax=Mesonia phycicola TaxID=579105 RepID=A0A1M6AEB9_9FLAO|nr:hypothetical protein [Mesonia phycicola]SHI34741.1 hypothetical protein SAMN04488096_101225 [Mesonia phycicola]